MHTVETKRTTRMLKVARENWQVLIQNAHPGYIGWEEFEHNEVTLRQNGAGFSPGIRGSLPREGIALLQGRVLCCVCGTRMSVKYQELALGLVPHYQCCEEVVRNAGKMCQSIRGGDVDRAISELLLDTVAPAALEVALAVQD